MNNSVKRDNNDFFKRSHSIWKQEITDFTLSEKYVAILKEVQFGGHLLY